MLDKWVGGRTESNRGRNNKKGIAERINGDKANNEIDEGKYVEAKRGDNNVKIGKRSAGRNNSFVRLCVWRRHWREIWL